MLINIARKSKKKKLMDTLEITFLSIYFSIQFMSKILYSVTNQYLKKFSYGFWDNQWFGRNQIYLKLKLGALQFMPGIKNLILIFFDFFFEF
jgi:hypothetical protein